MMIGKLHLLGAILGFMAAMPALADDIGSLPATAGGHAQGRAARRPRKRPFIPAAACTQAAKVRRADEADSRVTLP
ncbi:hypothetical protein JMK10_19400 [Rhodovulum sulfidophilum]|uniref:hypothetical protein n=1 Tax=Rhodovulum sulfidophilum TaxID=35806 RepID=UPI0019244FBF|nr:hypothetical protein [Rhodovulum sulfidophilum]MBL3576236.1 hypothetical protein [Rhodovulum sulfidophilum]MCE8431585.1 hypothetical protein [Rhodovulum sulfidophilum]MCF4118893.1 hypothetical protein [Rhodovulum sulfidophilum]